MQSIRPTSMVGAAIASTALLLAGCGGGGSPKGPGGKASIGKQALAFSVCMRSHGVPDFPDPQISGNSVRLAIHVRAGQAGTSDLNPNSPVFKSAQSSCKKLLPNGGKPTAAESAQAQAHALKVAECMRAHGVPNFPDPSQGGFDVGPQVNSSTPQFQAAQKTCGLGM